jgi:O-antigen/teichoic acid export membrane protein
MQVIQVAVTIVVARVAGASVLGTVSFGLAYVSMFVFIANLGLGSAHIKLVSEGRDEAACNGTFIRIQTLLVGVFFIFVLGLFLFQKYIFRYQFESTVHEKVILITLVAVTLSRVIFIFKTSFMSKTQQAKQDIPAFIELLIFQSLRLMVVLLGYKALAIAFTRLVAVILILPVYFFLFRNVIVGKFDRKLAKQYFLISFPVMIMSFTDSFIKSADRVLLQYLTNSAELGYYVAGFKIGSFILMIGASVGLLFFPTFSKAIAEKNFDRINFIIRKYEKFSLAFVFPIAVILSIYSDLIVRVILGIEYLKTIPVLSIINISAFIYIFFTPYGNVLTGKGLFKLVAKIHLAYLVFFLFISFIFVSPVILNLGSTGLAVALLLSNLFLGCLFVLFNQIRIKKLVILTHWPLMVFGIVCSIIALWIYQNFQLTLFEKIIFAAIYFVVYWGLGTLFRLISSQNWSMLLELVNVKKMVKYVKSEIIDREEITK